MAYLSRTLRLRAALWTLGVAAIGQIPSERSARLLLQTSTSGSDPDVRAAATTAFERAVANRLGANRG